METLDKLIAPFAGMTDGQIKPFADKHGISVHTIRNQLNTRTKNPRWGTVLKIMAVSADISQAGDTLPQDSPV